MGQAVTGLKRYRGPTGWRLWPLFPAVSLFIAAGTLQNSLIGFELAHQGRAGGLIGLLMAAYFGGLVLGAVATPRQVGRFGHFRAFMLAGLLSALLMPLYGAFPAPAVWFGLQLMTGFLIAAQYVVVESWLNRVADTRFRARLFGLYMFFWFLGAGTGPLMLGADTGLSAGMIRVAGLMAASGLMMLPLAVMPALRLPVPTLSPSRLCSASPVGAAATLLVGLSFGAAMGMTAAYGEARGFSAHEVSLFVAAFVAGGAITQYPIGHLADRLDRRRVLMACASLSAAACLPMFFALPFAFLCLSALLVGAFALPLYTLGVALVQDRTAEADRIPTAGGLLILNSLGAALGPLLIGALSDALGPNSLFFILAAAHLFLAGQCFLHAPKRLRARLTD